MIDIGTLPVKAVLSDFRAALKAGNQIIVSASPGAGKTTVIPPETAACLKGEIRLIEPRRVAARAAACRISELCASSVGAFAGYAVRGESRRSGGTRILAVTPGILIREFLEAPGLEGVGAVIFDEFHERSWECDFLLALALDVQSALRPDLVIIIMSATLGMAELKSFLPDARVIEAPGREFPVETVYRPSRCSVDASAVVPECVRAAVEIFGRTGSGDLLVFLPGAGEIAAAAERLAPLLPSADLRCLHGSLELQEQKRALLPASGGGRRIFLATNLAESSITIDGVTVVIDSGWEKRLTYSPGAGLSFLEFQRISKASADQRAGRAGRTAPGTAVRLYSLLEYGNLAPQRPPDLAVCDLAPLALHLADWGCAESGLRWLDPPPEAGMASARELLRGLGALDAEGRLTSRGRALDRLPLHPRLGNMLIRAKNENLLPTAAAVASCLESRSFSKDSADIRDVLVDMRRRPGRYAVQDKVRRQLLALMRAKEGETDVSAAGRLISFAFPEWIAQRRDAGSCLYRMAGGRAAELSCDDPLRGSEFLAVAVLGGGAARTRIFSAAPLDREVLEQDFADGLTRRIGVDFDPDSGRVSAREELRLGALILSSHPVSPPAGTQGRAVLSAAVRRRIELPPPDCRNAGQLVDRVRFAVQSDPEISLPDWSADHWPEALFELTEGYLDPVRSLADLARLDWDSIVGYGLSREQRALLDRLYPEFFVTPRGYKVRIDYSGSTPTAAVRLQELYGLDVHPAIGRRRLPLRLELLSPARRPVQVTMDLPGFWRGSWSLVRRDMRGRYPKHDWPEHPEAPQS